MRKIINKRKRYRVLEKYNYKCCACGRGADVCALEVDHIIPVSSGGTNDMDNLQCLCSDCNMGKFNDIKNKDNLNIAEMQEKLLQLKTYLFNNTKKDWIEVKMNLSFMGFFNWFPDYEIRELFWSIQRKDKFNGNKNNLIKKYKEQRDKIIRGLYNQFVNSERKVSKWLEEQGVELSRPAVNLILAKTA